VTIVWSHLSEFALRIPQGQKMADTQQNALLPLESRSPSESGTGPGSIISGMVSDAIAIARSIERASTSARFRIGDFEFCEPDFRQILIWAKALEISPQSLIQEFEEISNDHDTKFKIEDGSIVSLAWDFARLPMVKIEFVSDISIQEISLFQSDYFSDCEFADDDIAAEPQVDILICLRSLRILYIYDVKISSLKLIEMESLSELYCTCTNLTEIDLSNVPKLKILWCRYNQLTELNLTGQSMLISLHCDKNKLKRLAISNAPHLYEIYCDYNNLTDLDISSAHNLKSLKCDNNIIMNINLYGIESIKYISCHNNNIARIDISNAHKLEFLYCDPTVDIKRLAKPSCKK
jgi:Leucine-rich repeat (LRR) protein